MTEQDIAIVRARAQIDALTAVFLAVCNALGSASPAFARSLLQTANQKQIQYQWIALKGVSPELSDLAAGEFQEAFSDLIELMEKSLNQRSS